MAEHTMAGILTEQAAGHIEVGSQPCRADIDLVAIPTSRQRAMDNRRGVTICNLPSYYTHRPDDGNLEGD